MKISPKTNIRPFCKRAFNYLSGFLSVCLCLSDLILLKLLIAISYCEGHTASYLSCCKCNEKVDPSPEHAFIDCAKCHLKQKQTASKAHWFAQLLFQDTDDDKRDLTLFEGAIHQTAKLTSDTDEVKGLTQADMASILFTSPPICITYNRRSRSPSKVLENVSQ